MTWEYIYNMLHKDVAEPEQTADYYRQLLKNFDSLDENIRLMIMEKIINHAHDQGVVHTASSEDFTEADNRELKKWMFKSIFTFGMMSVLIYIVLMQITDYLRGGPSSFSELFKIFKVVLGL